MDTLLNSLGLSDPLAVLMACAWLALLMGHAGVSKLRDRSFFEQHLAAYRVPDALLAPLSWAVPALECLCVALLLSPWRAWGAGLCAVLLAAYALAMARQLQTGRRLDCGCGGEPLPVSWALVLRNMALLPVAAVAAANAASRPLGWGDFAVSLAALLLGALLWSVSHQILRQSARAVFH